NQRQAQTIATIDRNKTVILPKCRRNSVQISSSTFAISIYSCVSLVWTSLLYICIVCPTCLFLILLRFILSLVITSIITTGISILSIPWNNPGFYSIKNGSHNYLVITQ